MADPRDFQRQNQDFNPDRGGVRAAQTPAQINFVPVQQTTDTSQGLSALASLEPEIMGFLDRRTKKLTEEDIAAGREAAMKEAVDFGEAVRQGKLQPNQSKWFMKGYKSQYGEVLGQQWALEAKTAWTKDPAKNSDSPTAANEFISKFIQEKLQTAQGMDPDVRAGLLPHMGQMRASIMQAQSEWSAKQVMEKSLENIGTLITQDLDAFVKSGGKMSITDLTAAIKKRDAEGRLMGIDNDTLNRTVVQAVTAKAREMGSQSMLNVLKAYEFIGNNPKYANDIRSASDAITSRAAAEESRAHVRDQRARQESARYARMEAIAFINANPGVTDLPKELKNKLILADALPEVQTYQRQMVTEATKQRPDEIAHIEQAVFSAGPRAAEKINELIGNGTLRDPALTQHLHAIARANDDKNLLSDPLFSSGKQEILNLSTPDPVTGKVGADIAAAQEAATEFAKDFVNFRMAKPNATAQELNAKQRELIAIYSDAARTAAQQGEGVNARMQFYAARDKARIEYFKGRKDVLDREQKALWQAIGGTVDRKPAGNQ